MHIYMNMYIYIYMHTYISRTFSHPNAERKEVQPPGDAPTSIADEPAPWDTIQVGGGVR